MLIAILLSVFSTLLAILSFVRTGRIIQDQNDLAEALVIAANVQNKKLNKKLTDLTEDVHSALDCLVFMDAKCSDQNDDVR